LVWVDIEDDIKNGKCFGRISDESWSEAVDFISKYQGFGAEVYEFEMTEKGIKKI
jgi:hypothetical protein